jgi:hypothetical protein
VTGAKRVPQLPDVPTIAEGGWPAFEATFWFGLFAPRGTQPEIVAKLNAEVQRITADAAFRERSLDPYMFEPLPGSPSEFAGTIRADVQKWDRVIREAASNSTSARFRANSHCACDCAVGKCPYRLGLWRVKMRTALFGALVAACLAATPLTSKPANALALTVPAGMAAAADALSETQKVTYGYGWGYRPWRPYYRPAYYGFRPYYGYHRPWRPHFRPAFYGSWRYGW